MKIKILCGDTWEHKAHNWRWGFLWLRQGSCEGVTFDEFVRLNFGNVNWYRKNEGYVTHKHRYRIIESGTFDITFRCYWCDEKIHISRVVLQAMLLSNDGYIHNGIFYPKRYKTWL